MSLVNIYTSDVAKTPPHDEVVSSLVRQLTAQKAKYKLAYGGGLYDGNAAYDLMVTLSLATRLALAGITDLKALEIYKGPSADVFDDAGQPLQTSYLRDKNTKRDFRLANATGDLDQRWMFDAGLIDVNTMNQLGPDGMYHAARLSDGVDIYVGFYTVVFHPELNALGEMIFYPTKPLYIGPRFGLFDIGMIAFSIALCWVPGVSQAAGAAILGSQTAAAYPLLATIVGNAAIGTVLNGGDVKSAVTNAVIGSIGAQVGGYVGDYAKVVSGSELVGKAAAGMTSAIVKGGDPTQALVLSVAPGLIGSMFDAATAPNPVLTPGSGAPTIAPGGLTMDDFYGSSGNPGDYGLDFSSDYFPGSAIDGSYWPELDGNNSDYWTGGYVDEDLPAVGYHDPVYDPDGGQGTATTPSHTGYHDPVYDPSGGQGTATPGTTSPTNYPTSGLVSGSATVPPTNWSNIVSDVAKVAILGLQVYKSVGQPNAILPGIRTMPGGGTGVPNKNGTITINNPNGSQSIVKMPVGQPQIFADGSAVVNNGDGTFSSVLANGQIVTQPYGAVGGGGSNTLLLVGAAALGLAALGGF